MADTRSNTPPSADRYEALFGRISMSDDLNTVAPDTANKPNAWRQLAEDERYEQLNLIATYVAVFFAPFAAGVEILSGVAPDQLIWSLQAARWIELFMGVFFGFDILVGAMAYGLKYFKTPACWINIMAVAATGAAFFASDLGMANPRVLRILRTVRAVAKVGLVQKVGTKETVLGAEMLRSMGRDDAWYAVGILLLISVLGDFSIGQYTHWSDALLEIIIYGAMVMAVRWKAERNLERVGQVFMDRLSEANTLIVTKMREIPGLENAEDLIAERAREAHAEGRQLNEIGTMIEAVGMIVSNLRRFISKRAFLEARGERVIPTRSPVALMYTDVAGFQDLTRRLNRDVLPVLKRYLTEMNRGVLDFGGDIDKFQGEGIIAYFHNAEQPGRSAVEAFDAAVELQKTSRALSAVSEIWEDVFAKHPEQSGSLTFNTAVGLHFGEVVAGPVGDNERADSTLIGDNAILGQLLEDLNEVYGTNILLSESFHRNLTADKRVLCRFIDRVKPAGFSEPLDIYTVDVAPLPVAFLLKFEEALESYLDGAWEIARHRFLESRQILTDNGCEADAATETLIARIEYINLFWLQTIEHLRERVPDAITEAAAENLKQRFEGETWLPPQEWRGYWRLNR